VSGAPRCQRPPLPPDDEPGGREAERGGRQRVEQITSERQAERLADQHVLRIADQRRRRSDVRRACQRDEERQRREPAARARLEQHRRHREADDVVGEERREAPGRRDDPGEEAFRRRVGVGHAADDFAVEAAEAELRGEDHQSEEQRDRRDVDRRPRLFGREPPAGHDRDRTEQRDTAAVDGEAGQFAEEHPRVDEDEHGQDEQVHVEDAISESGRRPGRSRAAWAPA
jgi:hypothetical protein